MMRKVVLSFGLLLATAGCQVQSEEDMIEGSIRNTLSSQGNIQEVEITKQGEDNFSGFAVVRDARGQNNRLNCTASRNADKAANFDWRCLPTVDETTLTNVETAIRESLSQQSNVRQVDMSRQDDSNMTGFAVLQLADGSRGAVDLHRETRERDQRELRLALRARRACRRWHADGRRRR